MARFDALVSLGLIFLILKWQQVRVLNHFHLSLLLLRLYLFRLWDLTHYDVLKGIYDYPGGNDFRIGDWTVVRVRVQPFHRQQIIDGVPYYLTENCVLSVYPRTFIKSKEELRLILIRLFIGHCKKTSMRESKSLHFQSLILPKSGVDLVLKWRTVDGLTAISAISGISPLYHEPGYQSVKNGVVVIAL